MDVALGILILALSVAGVIVVGILFVWAARKDGEEDGRCRSASESAAGRDSAGRRNS